LNTAQVTGAINEVKLAGDTILSTLETVDPAVALPAATAEQVLNLVADLVGKALTAWSAASGVPITVESVQALLPNQTALTQPDPV
jgi:hypothetical protein